MIKVLIIDDDENFRIFLSHVIEKEFKAQIQYAGDGKEGLVIALQYKPDLIIVDDEMPLMKGYEMVDKLRMNNRFKNTPVMVMTASNDNDTITKYIEFNIADYIVKPINSAETIEKIKNIISLTKKTVLVVEDNRAFGLFVEKALRSKFNKVVVQHAENGNAALEKMEFEKPFLILLDIAMPEMSGKEFLIKIRTDERYKNIKVVMLTGQNEAKTINEITALGISDYILKPVTLEDLYSKLVRFLN